MVRTGRLLLVGLGILVAVTAPRAEDQAAPAVLETRAGLHPGYARLVFAAPEGGGPVVPLSASVAGDQLTIKFATPISVKLDAVRRALAAYLDGLSLSADGMTVTARLVRPIDLKPQQVSRIVELVDFVDRPVPKTADAAPPPPAAAQPDQPAKPAEPVLPKSAEARPAEAKPVAVPKPDTAEPAGPATAQPAPAGGQPPEAAPVKPAGQVASAKPETQPGPPATAKPAPAPAAAKPAEPKPAEPNPAAPKPAEPKPAEPKKAEAPADKPGPGAKPADAKPADARLAEPKKAEAPADKPAPGAKPADAKATEAKQADARPAAIGTVGRAAEKGVQIRYTNLDDGVSIRFEWTSPVAAAVFRRGDAVWLVFDRAQRIDFSDFKPATWPVVSAIAQVPTQSGTAIRMAATTGYQPSVRRAGNSWIVDLSRQSPHLDAPIQPAIHAESGAGAIELPALQPTGPVSLIDPEAGDTLVAVPLPELGQGVAQGFDFPDVEILGSVQGVALRPISDLLEVTTQPTLVRITAPGGLMLGSDEDRSLPTRAPVVSGALLRPADWLGKADQTFTDKRQALQSAIVAASEDDRTRHRLDLARFYFANGFAAETLAVLRNAERDVPNLVDDPRIRLMQGAAELMMSQTDEAAADLADHSLDGRVDTALWRAAMAAEQQDWKTAAPLAKQGKEALGAYPPAFTNRLALILADALLRGGDAKTAGGLAEGVLGRHPDRGQRDQADYLVGRVAADAHDPQKALKFWTEAAQSPAIDRGRAEAALALTLLKLETGQIKRADAIAAVDRLRYAWRGDDFEIEVLRKLAELYVADADYRMAFETLQRIATGFPDSAAARDATDRMQKTYAGMFLGPDADKLPPLTALGLFQQFRELTPPGDQGDAIIRKLADRLVSVDLLERAGNLLDDQVRTRLTGLDQARVAAQVALVRLLDNRPAEALADLDLKVADDLPADLVRQRTELRARAQFDLGKPDDALQTLAADESADADRLRAEIYEKGQNWPKLALILQKGLPDPGPDGTLDPAAASTVLRLATALSLAQDTAGLDKLQWRFGAAMDQSAYKDTFRIVAGTAVASGDPKTAADRVAQLGALQSFMTEYRQRLEKERLSAIN